MVVAVTSGLCLGREDKVQANSTQVYNAIPHSLNLLVFFFISIVCLYITVHYPPLYYIEFYSRKLSIPDDAVDRQKRGTLT